MTFIVILLVAALFFIVGFLTCVACIGNNVKGEIREKIREEQRHDFTTSGIDPALADTLIKLGDTFGPLGVALHASKLTDRKLLIERMYAETGQSITWPVE